MTAGRVGDDGVAPTADAAVAPALVSRDLIDLFPVTSALLSRRRPRDQRLHHPAPVPVPGGLR